MMVLKIAFRWALILGVFTNSFSKNYYVSNSGNDANDGLSKFTAWKTIAKVNSSMSLFLSGDSILFSSGDVFSEILKPTCSTNSTAPIVFSTYGNATSKAIISGASTVSGWVRHKGNIWKTYFSNDSKERITGLYINSVSQEVGRYPNRLTNLEINSLLGWNKINGRVGDSVIISSQQISNLTFTGATIVYKTTNFTISRQDSILHQGIKIFLKTPDTTLSSGTYGYMLINHLATLDLNGEWYHNKFNDSLYLYSSSDPNGMLITATKNNYILNANNAKNIVFNNLIFCHSQDTISANFYNKGGIKFDNCQKIIFDKCDFINHGNRVIYITNCNGFTIKNNGFKDNNGVCIRTALSSNITISGNLFRRTGLWTSMCFDPKVIVISACSNVLIINNTIDSCAYDGIYPYSTTNTTISQNIIKNYLLNWGDGGAIYTHYTHTNLKLEKNIIYNGGYGNEGTTNPKYHKTRGIYFDMATAGVKCSSNTIYNPGEAGMIIQYSTQKVFVSKNTIYDNQNIAKGISKAANPTQDPSYLISCKDTILNNLIFCKNTSFPLFFQTTTSYFNSVKIDSNFYFSPYANRNAFYLNKINNLSQWQSITGFDASSKNSPVQLDSLSQSPSEFIRFFVNENNLPQIYDLGNATFIDKNEILYTGKITLAPFSSIILLKKASVLTNNSKDKSKSNQLLKLYPNPSNGGVFNVLSETQSQVLIFDNLGKKVFEKNVSEGINLIKTCLNSGIYHVLIDNSFYKWVNL